MYITKPLSPRYPQISIEALWDFDKADKCYDPICDPSATITTISDYPSRFVQTMWPASSFESALRRFTDMYADVINQPSYRHLYEHFTILKRNGKERPIDKPFPQLRAAQDDLVRILQQFCPATHHASAYAYIKKRETIDAGKKHQKNESHWFANFDFTNFFGSTTPEFVERMLKEIYPFSMLNDWGEWALVSSALSVCFLDGGLPQGSPVSPMLTNIMMIPIDHALCNSLHNYKKKSYVYTRYADDMTISCAYDFDIREVEQLIEQTLTQFSAPFALNKEKTHYGSRAGRNHMLGFVLNANNDITVGYKEKKYFKAMLNNYILDRKNKRRWELSEIQSLSGKLSYYRHVEREYFDALVARMNEKYHVDVDAIMRHDIKTLSD